MGPRRVGVGEHRPMPPEALPHTCLQDRGLFCGMQPAAVHDANASMPGVPAVVDEPIHARARVRSRHAVQVAPISDGVLSALQLSDLTAVDAMRGEVLVRFIDMVASRDRGRRADRCSLPDTAARIRSEADDVCHRLLERVGVRRVIPARHAGRCVLSCALGLHGRYLSGLLQSALSDRSRHVHRCALPRVYHSSERLQQGVCRMISTSVPWLFDDRGPSAT
jgi:hypothetical protein